MSFFFSSISLLLGLHFFRHNIVVMIVASVAYFIFIFVRFRAKKILVFLSLFVLGALFAGTTHRYDALDNTYSGFVLSVKTNYFIFQSHSERYYVYEKATTREFGDYLVIKGTPTEFQATTYESQLDFNEYLYNKGVQRQLRTDHIDTKFKNPIRPHTLKTKLLSNLDDNASALVDAVLFNTKDYTNSTITLAEELNVISLLSTTGIYFSFFIRCLRKLYERRFSDRKSHILSLITVSPYLIFSFPKIGIIRVFINNAVRSLKPKQIHSLSWLKIIGITSLIILSLNPYYAFDTGFLIGLFLSFVITPTSHLLSVVVKKRKRLVKLIMPILVTILLLPFTAFSKGVLTPLSPLLQVLLVPQFEFLVIISFLSSLGIPWYGFINFVSQIIALVIQFFSKINLQIPIASFGIYSTIFLISIYFIVLYLGESKRWAHIKTFLICISPFIVASIAPIQPLVRNAIYFVNVGQGDSIIIQNHFHAVMIDTGGVKNNDLATRTLIPFMRKKQIYYLDALITTHDDFDHCGAADSLKEHYTVKQHLSTDTDFPYTVGDIRLENLNHVDASDENDSSLVLKLHFLNQDFLFMGDASTIVETKILEENPGLTCDVLKVGHHGSKSSTSNAFLKALQPKEAVISVGKKNSYHHPDNVVLQRLSQNNIKIRRTDEEGTISYVSVFGL